ncbi:MAG: hypothetical protein IJG85_00205 [Eubacteriaceae bacterium]|nr:hypothetical protein [Eubacteriaceae bacterium]
MSPKAEIKRELSSESGRHPRDALHQTNNRHSPDFSEAMPIVYFDKQFIRRLSTKTMTTNE